MTRRERSKRIVSESNYSNAPIVASRGIPSRQKESELTICMNKPQNSLSVNAGLLGRPTGFTVTVRDFEIANGAGFLVALCGDIMRMPALPKVPAACDIKVSADGTITGMKG